MLDGWIVIFTGPKLIDELRESPDDELSSVEGAAEVRRSSPISSPPLRALCCCAPPPSAMLCAISSF